MPDMFRCRPSSSIPTEEFLPDSLLGASQLAGGIRLTPQVSWLVSGINAPEGNCVAMSLPPRCLCLTGSFGKMFVLIALTTCCLHAVCVLFVGLTSTSDVFQSVGRLFETFVWDHRRCAPMMLCLFAARFARRPERLFTFCKSREGFCWLTAR